MNKYRHPSPNTSCSRSCSCSECRTNGKRVGARGHDGVELTLRTILGPGEEQRTLEGDRAVMGGFQVIHPGADGAEWGRGCAEIGGSEGEARQRVAVFGGKSRQGEPFVAVLGDRGSQGIALDGERESGEPSGAREQQGLAHRWGESVSRD